MISLIRHRAFFAFSNNEDCFVCSSQMPISSQRLWAMGILHAVRCCLDNSSFGGCANLQLRLRRPRRQNRNDLAQFSSRTCCLFGLNHKQCVLIVKKKKSHSLGGLCRDQLREGLRSYIIQPRPVFDCCPFKRLPFGQRLMGAWQKIGSRR